MPNIHTTVLQVSASAPEHAIIEQAATLLRKGDLVIFPTETVYGLGADALQIQAVERIFRAKERPFSDPLIVHIATIAALTTLVTELSEQALQLAQAFWPGPLTLILPVMPHVPKVVTAGLDTVAVRMPDHPVALALIETVGSPIAAPSANRFMHVSPTTAQHALADLNGHVPLILDSGPCTVGVESTVLDLCAAVPTILRPGGISLEALRTILPQVQLSPTHPASNASYNETRKAPGQLLVHYAPKVPTFLFDGNMNAVHEAIAVEMQKRQEQGQRVGLLLANEDLPHFQNSGTSIYSLGDADALAQVAARLFAGLRTLEETDVDVILCRNFAAEGIGLAIRDRLLKAAGSRIIHV